MSELATLRTLTGMPDVPAPLGKSALVMVDLQNTYTRGVMRLDEVEPAIDAAAELLGRARAVGIPVVHIMHDAGEGSPYDVKAEIGQIVDRVAPQGDEPVIVKNYPNSFVATDLDAQLKALGVEDLVLAGFMTHVCINSTARGAFSLGYRPTVVANATATRSLPGVAGEVDSSAIQAAGLAMIGDIFGIVVPDMSAIPD
ncbi:cysteine hydrolase [Gordonia sp. PP30]|uniref:cysteine hydrolase family protein n=1 Tax=unclassified Gordonia (in: high G+C Gram-positive bacteria) TaxID=2657482 RepID=UPI002000533D|nr:MULTISPECIES: cysteine hydrolase family protein [unclassified Gordonia (in: high G+C Gram-positive bacteria)]UQE76834.1 cysteine hydrolase [Gordonia sp. PP30]